MMVGPYLYPLWSVYDIAGGSNDDNDDNGVMLHGGIDKSTPRSDTCSIVYIISYLFLYHLNALENQWRKIMKGDVGRRNNNNVDAL